MGLDMYLYRVPKGAEPDLGPFFSDHPEVERPEPMFIALNQVAYWRKSNQVHRFFVDECAGGEDNCEPVYVHPEKLADLYDRCSRVLADPSLGPELLPTRSGFFFGSTDYDEWYLSDLKETQRMLDENVKNNPVVPGQDLYYQASW